MFHKEQSPEAYAELMTVKGVTGIDPSKDTKLNCLKKMNCEL